MIGNFPDHPFMGLRGRPKTPGTRGKPAQLPDPDEVCGAEIQTATREVQGYDMWAQCGHTFKEHKGLGAIE